MANEYEAPGTWQRLYDIYHAMSDEELQAANPDDLTDTARDVLRAEMQSRKLEDLSKPRPGFEVRRDKMTPLQARRAMNSRDPWTHGLSKGKISLTIFHDAIAAGEACDYLDEQGIEFELRDIVAEYQGGGSLYGGPTVALRIVVARTDQQRAMAILREKMGLFPLQEVEEADEVVDDGSVATLGDFGRREDADEVALVLHEAGFWCRIVANPDGSVEDDNCFTVEVKEVDQAKAVDAVEKSMEFPGEG